MTSRRQVLVSLGACAIAAPLATRSQERMWRVGFLGSASAKGFAPRVDALKQGLRELGYVEGRNLVFDYRWAEDDIGRLPGLAAELVRAKCDVIVTNGTPATRALKGATTTVPIVMATSGDAVRAGFVASLARPGGNITGFTFIGPDLYAKRIELLKEALPRASVIAHLVNPDNTQYDLNFAEGRIAATRLKLKLHEFDARRSADLDRVFSAMAKSRMDAVLVAQENLFTANYAAVAALAAKQRLPSIGALEFADAGGMIGYGPSVLDLFRRSATYVDKILKGARPADLPVEQPTKFELVINLKTAKALGVTVPRPMVLRADRVIE